jgi:acyl-CoA synthetase (AMP-forming)/AMP-acid ligase II
MHNPPSHNFAVRLLERFGENSTLIEAASGNVLRTGEVRTQIAGFAARFLSTGSRPGDRILLSCGINPATALAYLGAMYAGLVPVLLDERTHAASGHLVNARVGAKAVWSANPIRQDWAIQAEVPILEGRCEPVDPASLRPFPARENDLAVLMPTSGSTGVPRLVRVSHGNLTANTEAIIQSQRLGSDEKAMLIMPVSYCFGASVLHTHLYQGGSVVFDPRFMFPDKVLHTINEYGCTSFAGVPTVYNILLRRSNVRAMRFPKLRRCLQAGGGLEPQSVEEMRAIVPGAEFFVMYGQTEATARISCLPPERLGDKLGSAGVPLDNLNLRVVNDQGQDLPEGIAGHVLVSGPSVCGGYFDEPEASQEKFRDGWLSTGDLGLLDKDGYLWIQGRTSDFIKIRGYRVGLADVEARVTAVAGVSECAATGVQHPEAGEALAIFIVRDETYTSTNGTASLADRVRQALPAQWTCSSVKIISELPRTANGKIARSQLQTLA